MNRKNKRPPFAAMANEQDLTKESYLRDLKQNYARRKDNIDLIKSNNILASEIRLLKNNFVETGVAYDALKPLNCRTIIFRFSCVQWPSIGRRN